MSTLGEKLKVVLADSFTFYLKAHYFHWNIEGAEFPQYHEFFGNIYEEVFGSIDVTAEKIRMLDEYTPGSYKRFQQLSTIDTNETIPDARGMMRTLLADNKKVIDVIIAAMEEAGKEPKNKAIENYLQERLDAHQKHAWMLRSTLK